MDILIHSLYYNYSIWTRHSSWKENEMIEMLEISIEVTQLDINMGVPRNGCMCPIYFSTVRKLIEIDYDFRCIIISSTHVRICMHNNYSKISPLPVEAITFIRLFDENEPVEPFTFNLFIQNDY